ncbi:MAG TPA: SMP-30/gluconolactonase/LRE family protein [Blastocatellia bacterium]|nr:SMP-30/gluconolactonase/LRE family protein [Blastocatellia bacterium]
MSSSFRVSPRHIKRLVVLLVIACALFLRGWSPPQHVVAETRPTDFKSFESPQVHPLALTPDGTRLLAVNTPDARLSVFQLDGETPRLVAEIPVGLEPVSVAARNDNEAWVTNWLSDSVSIVNLTTGNVVRTLQVGDEPTDVVFAGTQRQMAFVCVSGTRQLKVYDIDALDSAPQVLDIHGKQPRALARDASGSRVFVSVFESGNQTTVVPAKQVKDAGGPPKASPKKAKKLPAAPDVGLIVKWDGNKWADERGKTNWTPFIPYTLSDIDLVVVDAASATPQIQSEVTGIGTTIGNAVFDPANNRLLVANLEAHNDVRFEPNLRGQFISTRLGIVSLNNQPRVQTVDLNPHINLDQPDGSDAERAASLALPADIARAADGTVYVAANGSAKVGVLNAAGAVQRRIQVGQGPTGLAIDEARQRLYVLNRFDESLSLIDLRTQTEATQVALGFNPEPQSVRDGRRFLYDAGLSAHGDLACASCHLNGHRDGLAWDLGDPRGTLQTGGVLIPSTFHPMKGPMTTQSLRGIIGNEPLHWRGDRSKLEDFNPAFMSLLGGTRQLTADEMAAFTAFAQTLAYPPNPLENLDRTLSQSAEHGRQLFNNVPLDAAALPCNVCHTANPGFRSGTNNLIIPGVLLQESQDFKVPQLRGLYQKTGMVNASGKQMAGFGFIHDGSVATLLDFLRLPVFTFRNDNDRLDVEAFVMALDSGTAPAVGLQVTFSGNQVPAAVERTQLLVAQADAGNCDLVVKGIYHGEGRGFVYVGNGMFQPDRQNEAPVSWQALLQAAQSGSELTFTGAPVGYGRRLGIDHNGDGKLDGDE